MAAYRGYVNFAEASLTSGTTYNILAGTAPANQRILIEAFELYGKANAAQTPGLVQFCRATSGGSGGTAVTPTSQEQIVAATFQSTWITQPGTPPTGIVAYDSRELNPQLGLLVYFPQGQERYLEYGKFIVIQFTPQFTGTYSGFLQIVE
jgi:hypothetical protein